MERNEWESSVAWRALLDGLRDLDNKFLTGEKAVHDEQTVAEGYRFLATILGVACDVYLFADPARPRFVDINTPFRRDRAWGGDNNDAYYAFAPVDPSRTYRVHGTKGDSTYLSLTVYNEPEPGAWSDRVVGIVNDTDLTFGPGGEFEFFVGPVRPTGHTGAFIELSTDAASAVTRDYQLDPATGRRAEWSIDALDPPVELRHTDAATARALRTVLRWVQQQFAIVPIPVVAPLDAEARVAAGHNSPNGANVCAEPYQVPDANFGWSARDACYSFGMYALHEDEALVITHTPPVCRFWSLSLWSPFMAGYDPDYARTSLNHGGAVRNGDGSVTAVIAQRPLEHPNAISTLGHADGMIAFRWFHADAVPAMPVCEVVSVADAPTDVT